MSTLYPQLRITDPKFNYVSSAKTDIRETFRRIQSTQNQELKEPLVIHAGQSLEKPLVQFLMIPDGFVLPVQWMEW